jgi:hypothetical protein
MWEVRYLLWGCKFSFALVRRRVFVCGPSMGWLQFARCSLAGIPLGMQSVSQSVSQSSSSLDHESSLLPPARVPPRTRPLLCWGLSAICVSHSGDSSCGWWLLLTAEWTARASGRTAASAGSSWLSETFCLRLCDKY